ncbi:GDP-mannose 4,6-dehydratase [bacterium]|nr:GDP-mannose 4,6-dehydratase [bacterium]
MKLKNKNVLVTGISGFVGSHLAKHLLDQGASVDGLIRKRSDGTVSKNLDNVKDDVRLIEGDLTDISSLAFALDGSTPDVIFHLGAQSFVPRSFTHPLETLNSNTMGTANLLEAVRLKDLDPIIVFAGSSEEYGLVISSEEQYNQVKRKYSEIYPEVDKIPELPITEKNPLRPLSPYALSKVQGEYLMRDYYYSYGMKTIISRGFNHEGAGRGSMFVTSVIANQVMKLKLGEAEKIVIGNVNAFRDWSHVEDIIKGYCLLAEKEKVGNVHNQGSMRTNSILSYILLSLELAGWKVEKIATIRNEKEIKGPVENDNSEAFGVKFDKTKVDRLMLQDELEFAIEDKGIWAYTDKGKILIEFDPGRFRDADVPILMSDTRKIQNLGFRVEHKLEDIIRDQFNYFMKKENRV